MASSASNRIMERMVKVVPKRTQRVLAMAGALCAIRRIEEASLAGIAYQQRVTRSFSVHSSSSGSDAGASAAIIAVDPRIVVDYSTDSFDTDGAGGAAPAPAPDEGEQTPCSYGGPMVGEALASAEEGGHISQVGATKKEGGISYVWEKGDVLGSGF